MASQAKSDAARENGKKSRGPVTPQGKKNSSRNALKHGMTAASFVLPGESEQDFEELLQAHRDTYQPANAVEMNLVETLALARWRLRRIAALESNLFENELALSESELSEKFETISDLGRLAFVFQEQTNSLALLIRYESSLTRLHDRTYKHLKELQKLRNEPTKPPCVTGCSNGRCMKSAAYRAATTGSGVPSMRTASATPETEPRAAAVNPGLLAQTTEPGDGPLRIERFEPGRGIGPRLLGGGMDE
jgi:hypothetical protein